MLINMFALKPNVHYAIYIVLVLTLMYTVAPGVAGYGIKECYINDTWVPVPPGKMCCQGTLEPQEDKDCCYGKDSNHVYYPRHNICCEGRVMPRYIKDSGRRVERTCCNNKALVINETMQCCGDEVVNRHDTLCCHDEDNPGKVATHVSGPYFSCCGIKVIDVRVQQCGWMKGKELPVQPHHQVCGRQHINLRTHKCCLGRVHDVPHLNPHNIGELNPDVRCCGQTVYNTSRQECCPGSSLVGTVVDRAEHLACCGQGFPDTRHQLCCMGRAVTKTSPQDKCCGPQSYNPRTHSCCGNTPFNTLTHYCCSGSLSQPLRKGQDCCGGFPIVRHQLCCFGTTPVNISSTQDDSCCRKDSTIRTYNSTLKSCNHYTGDIETRISPLDDTCEGTHYLPDEAVCCDGQVHHFPPGDTLGCCRWHSKQTVYSETSQMCCKGHLHNVSSHEAECCRTQAYKLYSGHNPCLACTQEDVLPPHQMCCTNQTYHTWYDGDACCGHVPYFSQEYTCCNGQVRSRQQSCEHTPTRSAQNSSPCSHGFPLMVTLMVVVRMVFMHSTHASL
ncbi:galaxin-like isoform X2 [Haliotis rubra]|uniref:galaxin-like isoform X2 n=1 Tax=Haliotis rubra TaxID=36100 RepID=UPI001EE57CBB|nr:galaxin-like isoform X2 [Haliotis rubra]